MFDIKDACIGFSLFIISFVVFDLVLKCGYHRSARFRNLAKWYLPIEAAEPKLTTVNFTDQQTNTASDYMNIELRPTPRNISVSSSPEHSASGNQSVAFNVVQRENDDTNLASLDSEQSLPSHDRLFTVIERQSAGINRSVATSAETS